MATPIASRASLNSRIRTPCRGTARATNLAIAPRVSPGTLTTITPCPSLVRYAAWSGLGVAR